YLSESIPGHWTKPSFAFRSGELSGITGSADRFRCIFDPVPNSNFISCGSGIKKMFDLQSDIETIKFDCPPPDLGSEVEIERIPVFKDDECSPKMLSLRSTQYKTGKAKDLTGAYAHILDGGVSASIAVFRHVRDRPEEPFLFHCIDSCIHRYDVLLTRDQVAGVDHDQIAKGYILTRVGRDHARADTIAKLSQVPDYANHKEGLLNMLDCRREGIIVFLQLLDAKYDGPEGYLERCLGFSTVDITQTRDSIMMLIDVEPEPSVLVDV
ncbi:hypothetical protein K439DRAFT_1524569, partial [Ramaria rubella]